MQRLPWPPFVLFSMVLTFPGEASRRTSFIPILGQQESHRSLQLEVKESGGREGGRDTYYESGIGQVLMNPTVREDWGGASVSEHWSSQRASSRGKVSERGLLQHRAQQALSKTQARNRAICPAQSPYSQTLGPHIGDATLSQCSLCKVKIPTASGQHIPQENSPLWLAWK